MGSFFIGITLLLRNRNLGYGFCTVGLKELDAES